jgi:3-hydroxyisobutyrate dehydrogenase
MVPEGSHVKSVFLTPETGVLATDLGSKLIIDCSTIDTATSLLVREELLKKYPQVSFYDAPVSGGVLGAVKGTLTFMVGCSSTDPHWALLKDLLSTSGTPTSIFPCGGPSLGLTAKLCNNYCSGLIAIATSEAMNIGIRSGMDPRVLNAIFKTSTAQSAIADKFNPVPGLSPDAPPSHGYKAGFKVQLMKKDFGLAVETAQRVGANLALGETGLKVYEEASVDLRCKDLDSRVVYRFLGGREDWAKDFDEKQ